MNQIRFEKSDYVFFILGIIFLSSGITIPIGIVILVLIFLKKINQIRNNNETFSTSFFNWKNMT